MMFIFSKMPYYPLTKPLVLNTPRLCAEVDVCDLLEKVEALRTSIPRFCGIHDVPPGYAIRLQLLHGQTLDAVMPSLSVAAREHLHRCLCDINSYLHDAGVHHSDLRGDDIIVADGNSDGNGIWILDFSHSCRRCRLTKTQCAYATGEDMEVLNMIFRYADSDERHEADPNDWKEKEIAQLTASAAGYATAGEDELYPESRAAYFPTSAVVLLRDAVVRFERLGGHAADVAALRFKLAEHLSSEDDLSEALAVYEAVVNDAERNKNEEGTALILAKFAMLTEYIASLADASEVREQAVALEMRFRKLCGKHRTRSGY
ncbi:hypothetical protein DBV05_g8748 [Lasiodiplodia theobromae]|uniref:Protein kinase domain-containing protein n=1 Tax=Lasiodiplodia theobromae TaxID=45133 RepID=A0A5N5D5F3_9PEZI|nr:hypothetical protein DBV05_g8748 [Lasiodiplodia theobromae]